MPAHPPPRWLGVTLAVVLTGLGAVARLLIPPVHGVDMPFIAFLPAVLIATVWGDWLAGLVAIVLGAAVAAAISQTRPTPLPLTAFVAPSVIALLSGLLILMVAEMMTRTIRQLAASEDRLRLLVAATAAFVVRLDGRGERLFPSPEWRAFTGQKHERRPGAWRDMLHPDDAPAFARLGDGPVKLEARLRHAPSGEHRWTSFSLAPVTRRGVVREYLGAVEDIHERKLVEERGRILADELAHRARNGIGMVQAVVAQSARGAASVEDLRDTVIARLGAMAKAQDILDLEKGETATLHAVVDQVLSSFDRARIDVSGPSDTVLNRPAAILLGLMIYELGTNAVKYGALSTPEGRVAVTLGKTADGLVTLAWRESGGPPVKVSERQGFGHRLLQTGPANLGGASDIRMEPDGVKATISLRP
ncbi:sensor histidine kinase [Caulobacter sp. KR2-114]|uniref:sensor histidine kinase n=1 Tax=Caulobacter sp. KR2-114 TaxID=3400912 RepID=UPI003C0186EF